MVVRPVEQPGNLIKSTGCQGALAHRDWNDESLGMR